MTCQLHTCAHCATITLPDQLVSVDGDHVCGKCAGARDWCKQAAFPLMDAAACFEGQVGRICPACWLRHDDSLDEVERRVLS